MITQEFRPKTFSDVAGQKLVVDTLKCIAMHPENSPKTLILQGEFGTGKTTCARIFARALNCPNAKNGEPCGNCSVCNSDLEMSPFYIEYDSAIVGNVNDIKALRDTFYYNSDYGYRVVVLDECHLISKQAQAALLKVFEETQGRIFFLMCTTDVDDVLQTIQSRSMVLRFNLIQDEFLYKNLKGICEKKGLDVPDEILNLIIRRSLGHARNAQMLLDQYILLGDAFRTSVKTCKEDFSRLLMLTYVKDLINSKIKQCSDQNMLNELELKMKKNKQDYADIICSLQSNSLVNLKVDYEETVLDVLKCMSGASTNQNENISNFATIHKSNFLQIYEILTKQSILNSFGSDKQFQAAMWLIYMLL